MAWFKLGNKTEKLKVYESDIRGYFPCCPVCGDKKIEVNLIANGRDTLACESCGARWHLHVGLTGLKWAELDVEADDGKGRELLGKRFDKNELRKMAQDARKTIRTVKDSHEETSKQKEIIREKEIIVKVRCSYCHNLYPELLDKCPHCGAKR